MLSTHKSRKVSHWFLRAVGQPPEPLTLGGEAPEVSRTHKFAALYLADASEVAPIVRAACVVGMGHAIVIPPDHEIVVTK